jgi:uncharacterized protein (TIGR03118 family)
MHRSLVRALSLIFGLMLSIICGTASAQYQFVNLDADQSGKARHTDPLLVNAWGLAYAPGAAFWISDAGSGWSTLYDGVGNPQSLQVTVPSASGSGPGSPTGIVYNGSQEFKIDSWTSLFLFATLDGTISGWSHFDPSTALIGAKRPGAVYTGLAITSKPSGNILYAADVANNRVDMFNSTFQLIGSFTDNTLPAGYAPFGIQDIKGHLLVAFAPADGSAGGVVDIYTEAGTFVKHFAQGSPLNQPWGFAVAPSNFGPLSNTLLISNNTDTGTINGFNPTTGAFVGTVKDKAGNPIVIDQLWGIEFGGGSPLNGAKNHLYYTAGPNGNLNGLFGALGIK